MYLSDAAHLFDVEYCTFFILDVFSRRRFFDAIQSRHPRVLVGDDTTSGVASAMPDVMKHAGTRWVDKRKGGASWLSSPAPTLTLSTRKRSILVLCLLLSLITV